MMKPAFSDELLQQPTSYMCGALQMVDMNVVASEVDESGLLYVDCDANVTSLVFCQYDDYEINFVSRSVFPDGFFCICSGYHGFQIRRQALLRTRPDSDTNFGSLDNR